MERPSSAGTIFMHLFPPLLFSFDDCGLNLKHTFISSFAAMCLWTSRCRSRGFGGESQGRVDSTRLCLVVNGTTRKTTLIYMLLCVVLNMDDDDDYFFKHNNNNNNKKNIIIIDLSLFQYNYYTIIIFI